MNEGVEKLAKLFVFGESLSLECSTLSSPIYGFINVKLSSVLPLYFCVSCYFASGFTTWCTKPLDIAFCLCSKEKMHEDAAFLKKMFELGLENKSTKP